MKAPTSIAACELTRKEIETRFLVDKTLSHIPGDPKGTICLIRRGKTRVQVSLRGTVFCAEAIPNRRFGDRFATVVPNDDGDCFAKTARNDTGLNGYNPVSQASKS